MKERELDESARFALSQPHHAVARPQPSHRDCFVADGPTRVGAHLKKASNALTKLRAGMKVKVVTRPNGGVERGEKERKGKVLCETGRVDSGLSEEGLRGKRDSNRWSRTLCLGGGDCWSARG